VEKANLVSIVQARIGEDKVSFSQAVDSGGVPFSMTPSTLKMDHQGPASSIQDIEPQLLLFIYEWRDRASAKDMITLENNRYTDSTLIEA
jgi:hypothetical protein